jgi:phenylacetate-CoA ligase
MDKIKLYQRLPSGLRSILASVEGYRLKNLRYGGDASSLALEATNRERWSTQQWNEWQHFHLLQTLQNARHHVPYYRNYWDSCEARGDSRSWKVLENWPIVLKQDLRQHGAAFLALNRKKSKMIVESTSGTTGTPVRLWFGRSAKRQWYALYETRVRGWPGVTRQDRWGILGAKRVVSPKRRLPPFWVWNHGMHQLYMSTYHLAPWSAQYYLQAIQNHRLTYLLGFTNSLAYLAREAIALKITIPLKAVIANGERLSVQYRNIIGEAFQCTVRETYGSCEEVVGATECEHGRLHLWPDAGIFELLDSHMHPVAPGEIGKVVATGLLNMDMPLIRYDVGDLAEMESSTVTCACGRTLPIIKKLVGRSDDLIVLKDGRRLVQFDGIFDPTVPIKEGQIVQKALDRFVIRVVPDRGWSVKHGEKLAATLAERIGEVKVDVEIVQHIERTWAGKFRVIVIENENLDPNDTSATPTNIAYKQRDRRE